MNAKRLAADLSNERDGMPNPLLELRNLEVSFSTAGGKAQVVRDVNMTVMPGQTVAVVGESGSGKSTMALAVLGLLADNGAVTGGEILFGQENLARISRRRFQELRGRSIGMVPQDPMSNLNPVWRIGFQIREALKANGQPYHDSAVEQLLSEAGLPDARRRARQYPHEFSGGMRQRALIAIGLAARPQLLIADEPTSALDVTVQRRILDQLATLTRDLGTAVLLITHDLGLAAERAEKIVVMYRGRIVESGMSQEILRNPQHPYTQRLIASAPSLASRRIRLEQRDRQAMTPTTAGAPQRALVVTENLTKVFPLREGAWGKRSEFTAVDAVTLEIPRGSTVAMVGESGSGKSTVARMVLGLTPATSGRILFDGIDVRRQSQRQLFALRRRVQPIFQDPYGSLDPMLNIYRTIEEPLKVHKIGDKASREKKVRALLEAVALPAALMSRFPHELSGGQRQRVAIARALALEPELVVCDEAVSALDVLVQAQVLQLLNELQERLGLTYLFITHDLAVVRQIADSVCVMEQGRIVERGSIDEVFATPQTEYTRKLLEAIPGKDLLVSSP